MMDIISVKREFCNQNSKIAKFQKKIAHLEKNKQFRFKELEKMPETREAIKQKVIELFDKRQECLDAGNMKKYKFYMNLYCGEHNNLKSTTRFRVRKDIHRANCSIRELEARIKPIREAQVNQENTIKEILYKEFIQCGKVI